MDSRASIYRYATRPSWVMRTSATSLNPALRSRRDFELRCVNPGAILRGLVVGFLYASVALGDCYYSWQRVPSPGPGAYCIGTCINNLGAVAGYIQTDGDNTSAFMWSPQTGRVQLPFPQGIIDMKANGINDLGHVAGAMWGSVPGWKGFIWDGANYVVIDLPAWANMIEVNGINNQDQVVGAIINNSTGPMHAFAWQDGNLRDLGPDVGTIFSELRATNQPGQAAGFGSNPPAADNRAFQWTGTQVLWLPLPSQSNTGRAIGMSNNGFAAGDGTDGGRVGVVWTPWDVHEIRPPAPYPVAFMTGVNDGGRAVGYYGNSVDRPIAWQNGVVAQIEPLVVPTPPILRDAIAINRPGQILVRSSASTIVLTPHWLDGDLTGDCHVGLDDLVIVLSNFGFPQGTYPRGDVNGDGAVDLNDLTVLLAHYGE